MAEIHPQLRADTIHLGRFPLCHLLLMNDATYPWFILVPDRDNVREIFQLSEEDQQQLLRESSHLAEVMQQQFHAEKLNIAALGNMVPQLHLHHIARYSSDPAWPAPVWGKFPVQPYSNEQLGDITGRIVSRLGMGFA